MLITVRIGPESEVERGPGQRQDLGQVERRKGIDSGVQHTVLDIEVIYSNYRVFFFLWIQSGGCKSAILRSFQQFLYFLHSKIWAHFHFGTFDP